MNYLIVNNTIADTSGVAARRQYLTSDKEKIMSEGNCKTREISLGDEFGDVAVKVNGVVVTVSSEGRVDWSPAVSGYQATNSLDEKPAEWPVLTRRLGLGHW